MLILLAIVWIIFQSQESRFLSAVNLVNLSLQITAVGLISVGVVLVLLLGEIDLSVGAVSGLCASIIAVLNVKHGWSPVPAIVAGIAVGAAIGLFQGYVSTKFGIPTFVVTLAGLLGWQGVAAQGARRDRHREPHDPGCFTDLAGTFLSDAGGLDRRHRGDRASTPRWPFVGRRRRVRAGLTRRRGSLVGIRIGAVAIGRVRRRLRDQPGPRRADRGADPASGSSRSSTSSLRRTRSAATSTPSAATPRPPAARASTSSASASIVFALASSMAAIGGIMAASRLLAVNQSSGGSDLLLLAIAGPVIAGTTLFGGRGSVWSALLGALVIGSISNGMDLLGYASPTKFMVTGAVLLGAVVLDSVARMGRQQSGRV